MKSIETNEWAISADGEFFYNGCESREVAIENLKDSYDDDGYVGRCVGVEFTEEDIIPYIETANVLYQILYDEVGEASESWELTGEQDKEISQIVAKAVIDYVNKNNLQPNCYKVVDIEFIEGDEQE